MFGTPQPDRDDGCLGERSKACCTPPALQRWLEERIRVQGFALLNDLLRQIEKERQGCYQAPWNFSDATEAY